MKKDSENSILLEQISNGDYTAFKKVYDTYAKNMFLYAYKVLDDKETCEDIVQNLFIDFWNKRNNLAITNLKAYLFQSVKYQIFNHIRNKKITKEDLTRLNLVDVSMNAIQKMEYVELEELIKSIIKHELPDRCQQIFILSRFEHKSNKEIAEELGITIQAVKNQISKGIQKIKLSLQSKEVALYILITYSSLFF
ncbi:RNA polymerase sigma-70 factor (ECF subfamily) [Wenyingzhuangia heitensis]|uniref:RNA polymerase sigma-70 factor (ECF subfamily) n=1 Tax=Wenyingzhuangia heitensis TaxID=1487859 RepID=A0ABX0UDV2_9FLAO|nr:RNA polymerase sigma-70 factor [Wenyingzhuangia heitensis]NIJ46524.1 RNA polymerase sigma-70 factor (ECF subfamily) [Wenyingzhuangia heitensis]